MKPVKSKLLLEGKRINVKSSTSIRVLNDIFLKLGCSRKTSKEVSEHLTDSSLCDMESHGIMRVLQYSEQFKSGYMNAKAKPKILVDDKGIKRVSGNGGIGIPVMTIAYNAGVSDAKKYGVSALSIRDVGHTGRHGAFADDAANKGVLTICVGGGNRYTWRQVAPYGGSKAILPTNPWCIGIPGGNLGPIVLVVGYMLQNLQMLYYQKIVSLTKVVILLKTQMTILTEVQFFHLEHKRDMA